MFIIIECQSKQALNQNEYAIFTENSFFKITYDFFNESINAYKVFIEFEQNF